MIFQGESESLGKPDDGHLEIDGSCSVIHKNTMMIFGGKTDKNQGIELIDHIFRIFCNFCRNCVK